MRSRLVLSVGMLLVGTSAPATGQEPSSRPASAGGEATATAPAATTRPTSEIVLIRVGDKAAVTQEDFEWHVFPYLPGGWGEDLKRAGAAGLVDRQLFLLYLEEHPELVSKDEVDAEVKRAMKRLGAGTFEELERIIARRKGKLSRFRENALLDVARNKLAKQGIKKGKDEASLTKTFEAHPEHFNGARMLARHIQISCPVYTTPTQRQATREQLAKIREDLVSGRRTWEECVKESHCSTKVNNGVIGAMPRHGRYAEPVARAAWSLEPGQMSDIVESHLGFHIIQVLERRPGHRKLGDVQTKIELRAFLQYQGYKNAVAEMRKKYPIVGVQEPLTPPMPPPRPGSPLLKRKAAAKSKAARPPATRPAPARPGRRPADRSAPKSR